MSTPTVRFRWKRHGLVVRPTGAWWMRSHAMIPTPDPLGGSLVRLYFSGRDERNRSHIGYAVIDLERPTDVLELTAEPVLAPGALGCFDDNGVSPSCLVRDGDRQLLYYIGWNPGSTVRLHLFGGLAASTDGGKSFQRLSQAPIIERTAVDPYLNTAPFVIRDGGWRMYYVSGVGWVHPDLPRYNIKLGRSDDGVKWRREGHVCIDFATPDETALARPFVVRDGDLYRMWFAFKGDAYRIGYAESPDGERWDRADDRGGLEPSEHGWDSEMVEYAAVVRHGGVWFMFYNGNAYGRDGIGLAISG